MNTFSPSVLRSAILCGLFSLLASSGPALAFSDDEARRAILDLREQVHQMAEQERRIRLDFAEQIEALKSEVMSLRGKVEQLNWAAGLHKNASGQDSADNLARVTDPQEKAAYEAPIENFQSGSYAEAARGFDLFLDAYPNSPLAPEAQFYRGSSLYATKSFSDAVKGLRELLSESPDDPRAADALLIIASSQVEMDDLDGAKASLQRIVEDYPDTSAAETAKERLTLF
ncbi:MAG TPA: tol-pal system protein YbgF [Burkholderiaceae bacterium]|nr:tol-pal system protein YbgF [Burkholderiaceae bacterium]